MNGPKSKALNEEDRVTVDLRQKKVAVLGGDGRMLEIMRLAKAAGAEVSAFGTQDGAEDAAGSPESRRTTLSGHRMLRRPCTCPWGHSAGVHQDAWSSWAGSLPASPRRRGTRE